MSEENEVAASPDLHPEVAAFDEKIAAAHSDDMSDSDKASLNVLIEERNEAYLRNHPVQAGEPS